MPRFRRVPRTAAALASALVILATAAACGSDDKDSGSSNAY